VEDAYTRCRSEALQATGNDDVYVEQLMSPARHIEVQVIGDGSGAVSHLGERECSIQRRHQKLVEIAPCPELSPGLRARIIADAVRLAEAVNYNNVGTFEFLVDANTIQDDGTYAFIEVNPRLQVEHTVTEEVLGLDLVKIQLRLAAGRSLADLNLKQSDMPIPRGFAVQVRINMETMEADGTARPAGGTLATFEVPAGRGIRIDTYGYAGYRTNPRFDSLLSKLIGYSTSANFADAVAKTYRALCEFKIEGVPTNIPFLQNLLKHPEFVANRIHTGFVEDRIVELAAFDSAAHPRLFFEPSAQRLQAGAKVDETDPLAVLTYGKTEDAVQDVPEKPDTARDLQPLEITELESNIAMHARMQGTIVSVDVREGDFVHKGQQVLVMESMKMEHVIKAEAGGLILRLGVTAGDTVYEGHPLVFIEASDVEETQAEAADQVDLDVLRADLAEVHQRHDITHDEARPDVVAKRKERGQRTARENISDLCDADTFVEFGGLVIAAQRRRRSLEDLIERTPTGQWSSF
jgi:pyruvate carboxylase